MLGIITRHVKNKIVVLSTDSIKYYGLDGLVYIESVECV
jgi:hypothetical protein